MKRQWIKGIRLLVKSPMQAVWMWLKYLEEKHECEDWIDSLPIEPREPGEQQEAYAEMMRKQYETLPHVKQLERCFAASKDLQGF